MEKVEKRLKGESGSGRAERLGKETENGFGTVSGFGAGLGKEGDGGRRKELDREFTEDVVASVRADYESRLEQRRRIEAQWVLNANFVAGNQYCRIAPSGDVEDVDRDYYWQEREVFNHIATIVDTRLAKLGRVRPKMSVAPASDDEGDVRAAKVSGKILASASARLNVEGTISRATMWSELTGSAFYKVTWDENGGRRVGTSEDGKPIYEGDVRVDVCPPYEILPDSLSAQSIEDCRSVIHAKAVNVDDIKRLWGADVAPEQVSLMWFGGAGKSGSFGLAGGSVKPSAQERDDCAIVIERYSMPSSDKPDGELAITAGKELLYYGPLPYECGEDGKRVLPFVEQNSITRAGSFYGTCMVERAIPVQRAYNAVKNRKHEFLNRIAMGVLTVEDGSVDADNLETEGLAPGKILTYRQGSTPPKLLAPGSVPSDFTVEEQRLLNEFVDVSGISEIMRSSTVPSTVTSGVAIQMLVEQDDTRISVTAENVRRAIKAVAAMTLRLYKQFASHTRLTRFVGEEGEIELLSWSSSDIGCDDVRFDTENEINSTLATRQSMMFDLLKAGLLYDENGKMSESARYKFLDAIGYGGLERTQDESTLHTRRAQKENRALTKRNLEVGELDDHALHIAEHTRYFLSSDFERLIAKKPLLKAKLLEHVREHKRFAKAEKEVELNVEG